MTGAEGLLGLLDGRDIGAAAGLLEGLKDGFGTGAGGGPRPATVT